MHAIRLMRACTAMLSADLQDVLRAWLRMQVNNAGGGTKYEIRSGIHEPAISMALGRKRPVSLEMLRRAITAQPQPLSLVLREMAEIAWKLELEQEVRKR